MLLRKAQSTLEYVVIVTIVLAGLIAMRIYTQRGFMGRLRSSTDSIGAQYCPETYEANYSTNTFSNTVETVDADTTTTETVESWTKTTGTERIGEYQ